MLKALVEPFNPYRYLPGMSLPIDYPYDEFPLLATLPADVTDVTSTPLKSIYQAIIDDIERLPVEGWSFNTEDTYTTISNNGVSYRLHGCLVPELLPRLSILGVYRDDVFTNVEQNVLQKVLISLRISSDKKKREIHLQEQNEKLKKLFPDCKI